jgi:hypothetical protein
MQIRSAPFFTVLMGDSHGYDEWAQRIAGGEWLGHEVFYQAPLYPYCSAHLRHRRPPSAAVRSSDRHRVGVVRAARRLAARAAVGEARPASSRG